MIFHPNQTFPPIQDAEMRFFAKNLDLVRQILIDHLGHLNILPDTLRIYLGPGMNSAHFLIDTQDHTTYHIKNPALQSYNLANSRLNEVFVYKLLELLGYGPKVTAFVDERIPGLALIATQDLTTQHQVFYTAKELEGALYCYQGAYLEHIAALDFLVRLGGISDISLNQRNHGIRIKGKRFASPNEPNLYLSEDFEDNIDTRVITRKVKPFIIDFLLRPPGVYTEKNSQKLINKLTNITVYDTGMSKLCKSKSPDDYYRGYKRLRDGKQSKGHGHLCFLEVVDNEYDYVEAISGSVENFRLNINASIQQTRLEVAKGKEMSDPLLGTTVVPFSGNELDEKKSIKRF